MGKTAGGGGGGKDKCLEGRLGRQRVKGAKNGVKEETEKTNVWSVA